MVRAFGDIMDQLKELEAGTTLRTPLTWLPSRA